MYSLLQKWFLSENLATRKGLFEIFEIIHKQVNSIKNFIVHTKRLFLSIIEDACDIYEGLKFDKERKFGGSKNEIQRMFLLEKPMKRTKLPNFIFETSKIIDGYVAVFLWKCKTG